MFLKVNQGLGRTYRNKNKRTKQQKQNQTKQKKKKNVTPPKTCALVLMMVYSK